jgi:hypothetical protein
MQVVLSYRDSKIKNLLGAFSESEKEDSQKVGVIRNNNAQKAAQ